MITESATQSHLDGYNSVLAGIGRTIQYTGLQIVVPEQDIVAESTSLGALDPFDVDAYNTLSGGTSVYISEDGPVVAFENTSDDPQIPVPSTLLLIGIGLLAVGRMRSAAI